MHETHVPLHRALAGRADAWLRQTMDADSADGVAEQAVEIGEHAKFREITLQLVRAMPRALRLRFLLRHPGLIFPYIFRVRRPRMVNVEEFVNG